MWEFQRRDVHTRCCSSISCHTPNPKLPKGKLGWSATVSAIVTAVYIGSLGEQEMKHQPVAVKSLLGGGNRTKLAYKIMIVCVCSEEMLVTAATELRGQLYL